MDQKRQERRKCCFVGCDLDAEFEIWDQKERRPDIGPTPACELHVGSLLGSVPPTQSDKWLVCTLRSRAMRNKYEAMGCRETSTWVLRTEPVLWGDRWTRVSKVRYDQLWASEHRVRKNGRETTRKGS